LPPLSRLLLNVKQAIYAAAPCFFNLTVVSSIMLFRFYPIFILLFQKTYAFIERATTYKAKVAMAYCAHILKFIIDNINVIEIIVVIIIT